MARKINFDGITPQAQSSSKPTEPSAPVEKGAYRSVGIGLRDLEFQEIDAIAEQYNMTRNSVLRLAVIRFIADVKAGKVNVDSFSEPPKPARNRLKQGI